MRHTVRSCAVQKQVISVCAALSIRSAPGEPRSWNKPVWRDVPLDVFQQIIPDLDIQEVWQMKSVCTDWSLSVRQAAVLRDSRLQVLLSKQNLATKILQLHKWRSSGKRFDMNVCFWLPKPLPPAELLTHMQILFWQKPPGLPTCNLDVWMPILLEAQTPMQCLVCVQEIIYTAEKLQIRHDFNLCVRMIEPAISGQGAVPTPEVVHSLGVFLKYFDFGGVSLWQDISCSIVQNAASAITIQHLEALLQCDLGHLTGRLTPPTDAFEIIGKHVWQPLSGLTGLTTLHLTFQAENLIDRNFAPLANLTCLQDLALQTVQADARCDAVLVSNYDTLKVVTLTARSWSSETYRILAQMSWLDRVTISVEKLFDAYWLQCTSPQCFQANLLGGTAGQLIWGMSGLWEGGKLQFHELTLHGIAFECLQHMPQLHTVTIIDCPSYPGRLEAPLSSVTSLEFVDRFAIQQSQGLLHIVQSDMPSLKRLAFSASLQGCKETVPMTTDALSACSLGRNLELLDLRGVNGLTTDKVSYLVSNIRKQQALGNAQPEVQVLLPFTTLSKSELALRLCYDSTGKKLLLPLFHKMFLTEDNRLVVRKS